LTEVTFTDGGTTRYALPVGIRPAGDPIAERAPDFIITWKEAPARITLYDAVGDSEYIEWVLDAIREDRVLPTSHGEVRYSRSDPASLDTGSLSSVRHLNVE